MNIYDAHSTSTDFSVSGNNLVKLRTTLSKERSQARLVSVNTERLVASDLAFLSHNASMWEPDSKDSLHPSYQSFRDGTNEAHRALIQYKLRRAVFDMAASLDHISGGTTMVIHMPAAMEPGTPALPEYIKAHVYLSPATMQEIKDKTDHNPVPDVVQTIITEIGVPSVERFDRCRKKSKYYRPYRGPAPLPLPVIEGLPDPIPANTGRYQFYGHRKARQPDPSTYFANSYVSETLDGTATQESTPEATKAEITRPRVRSNPKKP